MTDPAPPPATHRLVPGDTAPAFSLTDAEGKTVDSTRFAEQKTVLYFYPAASTPGCTTEACDFRDNLNSLKAAGYSLVGISPDRPEKLARFAQTESLTFPLLSDPDHQVAKSFGAWGEKKNYGKIYEGLIRSTFVLDEEGIVRLAQYNVRATGHVTKLLRDLGLDG